MKLSIESILVPDSTQVSFENLTYQAPVSERELKEFFTNLAEQNLDPNLSLSELNTQLQGLELEYFDPGKFLSELSEKDYHFLSEHDAVIAFIENMSARGKEIKQAA